MPALGSALKDGDAGLHVDRHKVECVANRGGRQFSGKDRFEHLHARSAGDLFPGLSIGRPQTSTNCFLFSCPPGNNLIDLH